MVQRAMRGVGRGRGLTSRGKRVRRVDWEGSRKLLLRSENRLVEWQEERRRRAATATCPLFSPLSTSDSIRT